MVEFAKEILKPIWREDHMTRKHSKQLLKRLFIRLQGHYKVIKYQTLKRELSSIWSHPVLKLTKLVEENFDKRQNLMTSPLTYVKKCFVTNANLVMIAVDIIFIFKVIKSQTSFMQVILLWSLAIYTIPEFQSDRWFDIGIGSMVRTKHCYQNLKFIELQGI